MSAFEISRSTHIEADPARVHALLNDFHEWRAWSPWEGLDPAMSRDYDGPKTGVGATYAWSGNRKAGAGSMEITESNPERVGVNLSFLKPMKALNTVTFELTPAGHGTDVTWRMNGTNSGLWALFAKLFSMDKLVGKDFERGLEQLKRVAEG